MYGVAPPTRRPECRPELVRASKTISTWGAASPCRYSMVAPPEDIVLMGNRYPGKMMKPTKPTRPMRSAVHMTTPGLGRSRQTPTMGHNNVGSVQSMWRTDGEDRFDPRYEWSLAAAARVETDTSLALFRLRSTRQIFKINTMVLPAAERRQDRP
jgi:hypothetical protein